MARHGDKGPYADWNVQCITFGKNSSDKAKNNSVAFGIRQGGAVLTTADVVTIFTENGCCLRELGHRFGVKHGTIWDIRSSKIRRRETTNLTLSPTCKCRAKGIACLKGFTKRRFPHI